MGFAGGCSGIAERSRAVSDSARFEEVVHMTLHPDLMIPEIVIDAEIQFKDINQTDRFARLLRQMQPQIRFIHRRNRKPAHRWVAVDSKNLAATDR